MSKLRFVIGFLVVLFSLTGCSSSPEDIVKNGALSFDTSVTVGDVLGRYDHFSSTSWTSFEDAHKRTIVEFRGVMNFDSYAGSTFNGIELSPEMVSKAKENTQIGSTPFLWRKIVPNFYVLISTLK